MQGFANHINVNSEKFRKRFVRHEGKKMLLVDQASFIKGSPDNNWQDCFSKFSDMIEEDIGSKRNLFVSNFSTTGPVERAASEIVLMGAMKNYYKYAVRTLCGIPSITLFGTDEDWINLVIKAEVLSEYELGWWLQELIPVLEKMADAATGTIDNSFWNSMYKMNNESGGPTINGWINKLFPYILNYQDTLVVNPTFANSNRYELSVDNYTSGLATMPFKWEYYGKTYDMGFIAGFVGSHQDEVNLSIEPVIGWAISDMNSVKDNSIDPKEDW
jgi:hypothetical protein